MLGILNDQVGSEFWGPMFDHLMVQNLIMAFIRSAFFWLVFSVVILVYGTTLFIMIPFSSKDLRYGIIRSWCALVVNLMRNICGLHFRFVNMEVIPKEGPIILLSKHQSGWETMAFTGFLPRKLSFVYKKELHRVPVFGWGLASLGMLSIDRSRGKLAFELLKRQVPSFFKQGWALVLFPEGTRTRPGKVARYKTGGARIAVDTGTDVIPVALNSGEFWPKGSFVIHPGEISVVFGPKIKTQGLDIHELNHKVSEWIESEMRKISPNYYK